MPPRARSRARSRPRSPPTPSRSTRSPPATTTPYDDAAAQIKQQLEQQAQQEQFSAFLADYRDHWVEQTICSDDFLTERCDNFKGNPAPCPDPSLTPEQQQQQLQQSGCPPPVLTISPAPPGTITAFQQATGGQPQKPHPPGEDQAPTPTLPGGAGGTIPVSPGAGGATQVPAQ